MMKKINFSCKTAEELKNQKSLFVALYNNKTLEDHKQHNAYIYHNDNKYIIVDCDDKDSFKYMKNLLFHDLKIDSDLNFYTRSISNYLGISKNKFHFYFQKGEMDIKSNKIGINNSKLDILVNQKIFEPADDYDSLNETHFPIMTNKIFNIIMNYNKESEFVEDNNIKPMNEDNIEHILKNINPKRFDNYQDWISLYMIFINEDYDIDLFYKYTSASKKYNKKQNEMILKNIKPRHGLSKATLYHWLKEDNMDEFKKIVQKNNSFFDDKIINNNQLANLYYNMNPNQYLYNKDCGWYAYNKYNVLSHYRKEAPTSLLNDVSTRLQQWLDDLKNTIPLSDEKIQEKTKTLKHAFKTVGSSAFIKGTIDYLKHLYNVDDLINKIDNNKNVIAFDNILYDLELGKFRNINTDDFILKTAKYTISKSSNPELRKDIEKLLYSIFENDKVIEFWKKSTALSVFGKTFESLYIHTGSGRNGKGVLSSILKSVLGDYFVNADNTFLTTVFKSGNANPTLASAKGSRFLLITEPDNGTAECKLNLDFVKAMTGGDPITTRNLYESNITYNPFFSLTLQCNQKPKLSKIDKAIEERLKIINYPFTFVDNPKFPNERQKDNNLKIKITQQDFINEFMLFLLEVANENKYIQYIEMPDEIKEQNQEYISDNNNIMDFINEYYEITKNDKDRIKTSEINNKYNEYAEVKVSASDIKQMMEYNRFKYVKSNSERYYCYLKRKVISNDVSPLDEM